MGGNTWQPDFQPDGRKLLAECTEFKLWEMYYLGGEQVLESSDAINKAL